MDARVNPRRFGGSPAHDDSVQAEKAPTEVSMIFDYALAGVVTAGLMIYLVYALLRPEQL